MKRFFKDRTFGPDARIQPVDAGRLSQAETGLQGDIDRLTRLDNGPYDSDPRLGVVDIGEGLQATWRCDAGSGWISVEGPERDKYGRLTGAEQTDVAWWNGREVLLVGVSSRDGEAFQARGERLDRCDPPASRCEDWLIAPQAGKSGEQAPR
ncbi:MAG: hypothetical protein AB1758_24635 [Candidatus Eremiobacterota bacterium]